MENKLKCEIVQDLLPSYVDGLTSDVTNEEIQNHMEDCNTCKNMLRRMQEPEPEQAEPSQIEQIDYLKNTRKKTKRVILACVLAAVMYVAAVLFIKFYCVGSNLYSESVVCNVEVSGNQLSISGTAVDSGIGISDIAYGEEDGVVNITMWGALASPWNKGEFESDFTSANEITQVRLAGKIIWDNGTSISAKTSTLYREQNPYVGDIVENIEIAEILGIPETLGKYTNELQTVKEPYGWKLVLENPIAIDKQAQLEEKMKFYSYVLIAAIGNLDYVTFVYDTKDGKKSLTITSQDATEFAGHNIKECYASPSKLQKLVDKANL